MSQNSSGPLVSVIVPVYNSYDYLRQCLDSILAQTYRPIEILIGEDASPDRRVVDIIRDYETRYPDIIRAFFHEKNLGAIGNMNFLTPLTKGEFIVNFAGDDVMLPTRIEKAVDYLLTHPDYALCHHDCTVFQSETNTKLYDYSERFYLRAGNIEDFIAGRYYVATNTVMFKKQYLPEPILDGELGNPSDWDFIARYMENANSDIGYIPEVLILYRRHDSNLSSRKNDKIYDQQVLAMEKCIRRNSKHEKAARLGISERSFSYALLALRKPSMFPHEQWKIMSDRISASPLGIWYGIVNIVRYVWANKVCVWIHRNTRV